MTTMDIVKLLKLQPKDVNTFIRTHATFRFERDSLTGEITIPNDVDIDAFFAPLFAEQRAAESDAQKAKRAQEEIQKERARKQEEAAIEYAIQQENRQAQARINQENQDRQNNERFHAAAIENLKKSGAEGYYQYKILSLVDQDGGHIELSTLTENLNTLGIEGWRLVVGYANELGHNTRPNLIGSTNATIDQNILIFERFVKFE